MGHFGLRVGLVVVAVAVGVVGDGGGFGLLVVVRGRAYAK